MRSAAALIAVLCSGCASMSCTPVLSVQWWAPPLTVPASDRVRDIKSVTFIHCKE